MRFNADRGLIIVRTSIVGSHGPVHARLALDTGATMTVIDSDTLRLAGISLAPDQPSIRITTGSGVIHAPRVRVSRLLALQQERQDFQVVSHTMPSGAGVDGVLGLDFMRGQRLTVDFRAGEVSLN